MPFMVQPTGGQLEWSTPFQHKDIQTQFFFAKLKTISLGYINMFGISNKSEM